MTNSNMTDAEEQARVPTLRVTEIAAAPVPVIDSRELLRASNQLRILHAGQVYTLRQTRENKLILTK